MGEFTLTDQDGTVLIDIRRVTPEKRLVPEAPRLSAGEAAKSHMVEYVSERIKK